MCGIFGTLRPHHYPPTARQRVAAALLILGALAEERGTDSAGIATLHTRTLTDRIAGDSAFIDRTAGRTRIVTALSPFSTRIPQAARLEGSLRSARTVLGHTRWATQGAVDLSNCSPLIVGAVMGTHNGDITVPFDDDFDPSGTDSAWLFSQLISASTVATAAAVLSGMRGRAALAWINATRPGSLFLARAALSPLSLAQDAHGALWWASNPGWLRHIGRGKLQMSEPQMLLEGTVLEMRPARHHIDTTGRQNFTAVSRARDRHLAHAIWRGFTKRDLDADRKVDASPFIPRERSVS